MDNNFGTGGIFTGQVYSARNIKEEMDIYYIRLDRHRSCVQGKYWVVVVVVAVVVVGAWILLISLYVSCILSYVFSSLGYPSSCLYILHTFMWRRGDGAEEKQRWRS